MIQFTLQLDPLALLAAMSVCAFGFVVWAARTLDERAKVPGNDRRDPPRPAG